MVNPEYFRDLIAIGAEVAGIADPREVLIDCRRRAEHVREEHLLDLPLEPDLTHLWLEECDIGDATVLPLIANHRLEVLEVGTTRVTAAVLHLVPGWQHLARLGIGGMTGINEAIECLMNHPSLEGIDLSRTDITAANLERLLLNSKLNNVDISGTGIGIPDVEHLNDDDAEPSRLVSIRLNETERCSICLGFQEQYRAEAEAEHRKRLGMT